MSIARHHAEWLSLLEISGPFLSMPVLLDAFPQGLDARDAEGAGELRAAFEEWADNQGGLRPDPAIHTAWVRYVLGDTLRMPAEVVSEGQAIPEGIKATIPEHGETLRPDLMVVEPGSAKPRLLIRVYPAGQDLEKALPDRAWKASPATRMMELLHATEVRLGLMTNGERWTLVYAPRGETTSFISWYASLWLEEPLTLRAFHSLLGVERFFNAPDDRTLEAMLQASAKDQHEVTDQLGYQVRQAVEILVHALDRANQDRGGALLASVDEERLYETALTVMMRLVFLLAAEERGLLLLGDPTYDQHYAVSTLRAQLREMADQQGEDVLERRYDAWCRLLATFRAVYGGVQHEDLRLPAYGGSLFDPDRFPFLEGRESGTHWRAAPADPLPISNRTVLHLLEALQVLQVTVPGGGPAEARRLSFRALDIEQIGHVYEGLLDHVAVRAQEPVLGLVGTKDREPEIPLSELEQFISRQDAKAQSKSGNAPDGLAPVREEIVKFLRDQTGRSPGALRNALDAPLNRHDALRAERLRAACGNDPELFRRVAPFAGLLREDDVGFPVVILPGSVYVTAGPTRRATGTHYTPRSLTEPIVQHTLEPLVYDGPAEGKPREAWELRHPAALLDLKVCDMAMGSGAFLVQACRYLSERLVEAWDRVSRQGAKGQRKENLGGLAPLREPPITPGDKATTADQEIISRQGTETQRKENLGGLASLRELRITPEGKPATGDPAETIIPIDQEERLILARRLVADRCLYGVDKNPLAVEMAKLSLWLITLDKNRSFTFLDHALRHGDSIVGADEDMFLRWAHSLRDSAMPLFAETLQEELATAGAKRRELQSFEVREVADAERKAHLLAEAEAAMARVKLGGDLLVGARLLDDLSPAQQDGMLAVALIDYTAGKPFTDENAERAVAAARRLPAFHWPFEFPEVFAQGGFSAFVGNPPFRGGLMITRDFEIAYTKFIKSQVSRAGTTTDLCAYFFRRAYQLLKSGGLFGYLGSNTISQGDTRNSSLAEINRQRGSIYRATTSMAWPGSASLHVAIVHVRKGGWAGAHYLDDQQVSRITPNLTDQRIAGEPKRLVSTVAPAFLGTTVYGNGFFLGEAEVKRLVSEDPKNTDVIRRFLNGNDVVTVADPRPLRWVLYFQGLSLEQAKQYTVPYRIAKNRVYPQRQASSTKRRREKWWLYASPADDLYASISTLSQVLVTCFTSKYIVFTFMPPTTIFANTVIVVASERYSALAILQSSFHEHWVKEYSSTLETRQRYALSDCYETFPATQPTSKQNICLDRIGEAYHEHRRQIMLARQEGLTATYNRFHDPEETASRAAGDIARLRELHVEMDRAVAAAYGWEDLDLGHGFHETAQGLRFTIRESARREVLTRLLELNHERYAEEVRQGLHEEKGKKKAPRQDAKAQKKENENQPRLL